MNWVLICDPTTHWSLLLAYNKLDNISLWDWAIQHFFVKRQNTLSTLASTILNTWDWANRHLHHTIPWSLFKSKTMISTSASWWQHYMCYMYAKNVQLIKPNMCQAQYALSPTCEGKPKCVKPNMWSSPTYEVCISLNLAHLNIAQNLKSTYKGYDV